MMVVVVVEVITMIMMMLVLCRLMGSYESMRSCTIIDVLHDFTGGLVESYCLERDPPQTPFLVNSMLKALERQSLVGCCIHIQVRIKVITNWVTAALEMQALC